MNQNFTILLLFVLSLGLSNNLSAQSPIPEVTEDVLEYEMTVYQATKTPTIDGDLTDWINLGAEFHYIGDIEDTVRTGDDMWDGEDDRSCIFSYLWDSEYLYFGAANFDDIFTATDTYARAWAGDCIWLWTDTNESSTAASNKTILIDFEDTATLLSWDNANVGAGRIPYPKGEIAIVYDEELGDAGYFVEAKIPLEYFEGFTPEVGYLFYANVGLEEGQDDETNLDGWVFLSWKPLEISQNMYPFTLDEESPNSVSSNNISMPENTLKQNYPNPFNSVTNISYSVFENSKVALTVYNIMGQEVATLVNEVKSAGTYTLSFDATGLNSGVYFYKLTQNNQVSTKKMLLTK